MNDDNDRFAGLIEPYVTGELEGADAEALERHLPGCPPCAARLERESRLEASLHELAAFAAIRRTTSSPLRRKAAYAAALAAAVVVALIALIPRAVPPADHMARARGVQDADLGIVVACPDETERAACVEWARSHGIRIDYPAAVAQVPRYELMDPTHGAGATILRSVQLTFD